MKRNPKPTKFDIPSFIFSLVLQSLIIVLVLCIPLLFVNDASRFDIKYFGPFILLNILTLVAYIVCKVQSGKDDLTKLQNQYNFTVSLFPLYLGKKFNLYAGLFLNLKNFKFINRKVGSDGGDEVLQKYAKALKHFLVKGEHVSRLGGDNFIIIVYKHRLQDFLKFLENVEIPVYHDDVEELIQVETRAGILNLNDSTTVSDVFNLTSIALNYAKAHDYENFMWFKPFMAEELYKDKEIAFQFNNAIKRNEIEVYYQPIVDIESNRMIGAEALARWNNNGEIILPTEFVPRLENNGLIQVLDFYILKKVCADVKEWKEKGLDCVVVSTNFSKKNLRNPDFAVKVLETINTAGVDKNLIQIELTESSDTDDSDVFADFIDKMAVNKISTAVDDFGVGFSSLNLLKNRHIKTIKLDKSFINNIENNTGDNTDAYLVKNIIHTCYDLKKNVICEGVENLEQKKLLKDMRSFLIQGFLYDKPLNKADFETRLNNPQYEEK